MLARLAIGAIWSSRELKKALSYYPFIRKRSTSLQTKVNKCDRFRERTRVFAHFDFPTALSPRHISFTLYTSASSASLDVLLAAITRTSPTAPSIISGVVHFVVTFTPRALSTLRNALFGPMCTRSTSVSRSEANRVHRYENRRIRRILPQPVDATPPLRLSTQTHSSGQRSRAHRAHNVLVQPQRDRKIDAVAEHSGGKCLDPHPNRSKLLLSSRRRRTRLRRDDATNSTRDAHFLGSTTAPVFRERRRRSVDGKRRRRKGKSNFSKTRIRRTQRNVRL